MLSGRLRVIFAAQLKATVTNIRHNVELTAPAAQLHTNTVQS
jgi:hypothetical protein